MVDEYEIGQRRCLRIILKQFLDTRDYEQVLEDIFEIFKDNPINKKESANK